MNLWYVVIAKQNQDHLAANGLREQGFADVYLPKTFEKRRTDRGHRPVGDLLLSPYFFVLCDVSRGEHGPIKNTRGVQELICDKEGRPSTLHDGPGVISRLRQAEDDEFCSASAVVRVGRQDLRRGMLVQIDRPGFEVRNVSGHYEPLTGRIIVMRRRRVEILCGAVTISLDETEVSEVKDP